MPSHLLGYEPSSGTLPTHSPIITCTKSQTQIVNTITGEVLRNNECDNAKCAACAPARCRRVARHAAWALSAAPFVWSMTISPIRPDPGRNRLALNRVAAALRRYGEVGYLYAVEQAGQTHAHVIPWSDYDISAHHTDTARVVIRRVAPTYLDRLAVALYVTKNVHKFGNSEQHLQLNGRLYGASNNFWYGFKDYRHLRREYREQQGWRPGSEPGRIGA